MNFDEKKGSLTYVSNICTLKAFLTEYSKEFKYKD